MNMKTLPDFWFEPLAWIDGQWHPGGETVTVRNPATGEKIADVSHADAAVVTLAIEGAVKAQRTWREVSAVERGMVLKRTAALLLARKDEFARLLTAEQGKPYSQAAGEVEYAASFFQWFGEEARRVYGRIAAHPEAGREFFIEHKPAGVAGLITPWNFPLAQGAKKVAAALAAGCSAVWKPAELTPLIALAIGPLMRQVGLPDGVLQIVPGRGSVVGAVLAEHPAVRVLSLTGSTATGSALMVAAAPGIKRLSLELGGNAPFIVLPDADLDFVAEQLMRLKLFVSGQVCVTANRVFVHADAEAVLAEKLAEKIRAARLGNGLAEGIKAGPLIHRQACREIGELVEQAVAAGAEIVAENRSYEGDATLREGSFFPPTLLVGVNEWRPLKAEIPFGGIKHSGIGGEEGLREFLETQVISMPKSILAS